MELRFLSGRQLPLFTQQITVADRQGSAEADHAPVSVSQNLHDSYEVCDAPVCATCGSLMVPQRQLPQMHKLRWYEWLLLIAERGSFGCCYYTAK